MEYGKEGPGRRRVAIIGGARIPFARSGSAYHDKSNKDLLTATLKALVSKYKLEGKKMDDVAGGAVLKHAADFNLTRESVLSTDLLPSTPGVDLQRACGTGLDTVIYIANKIALGQIDVGIACGTDTNSDVPLEFSRAFGDKLVKSSRAKGPLQMLSIWKSLRPGQLKPIIPSVAEPRTHMSMGQHCELMAQEWKIPQSEQDELALASHQKAAKAYADGFYRDLVFPYGGIDKDNNLRPDTSLEKLAKLKPSFEKSEKGTLTAGNSTPLTDGASAVLLASEEWAKANGFIPECFLIHSKVAAVDFVGGEGLLMAPTIAVSNLLKDLNLGFKDFDFFEIHEAFAAQALANFRAWESEEYCKRVLNRPKPLGPIDREKLNVKGGSVGIGHPFAATGGRLVATLAKTLKQKGSGRGLISVCTAGGMGVAAVLER